MKCGFGTSAHHTAFTALGMLGLLLGAIVLSACAAAIPPVTDTFDCGEGSFGVATGDKNFSNVRECVLNHFQRCVDAVGSLTSYTIEGDPITDTYHVVNEDGVCRAKVVHDASKDRFAGDTPISIQMCDRLDISTEGSVAAIQTDDCKDL